MHKIVLFFLLFFNSSICFAEISKTYNVEKILSKDNVNTYYTISENKNIGVADKYGNLIIPCEYDKIETTFVVNQYNVQKDNKKGIISAKGELIVPVLFDSVNTYHNYFIVRKNQKFGLYSSSGIDLIPLEYDLIVGLSFGRFLLLKNNKYFLYNTKNDKIINLPFDKVVRDSEFLIVEKNGKKGLYSYIDEKLVIPLKYDDIKELPSAIIVSVGNKKGLVNRKSFEEIYPPIYKNVKLISYNFIILQKQNDKYDIVYQYRLPKNPDEYKNINKDVDKISDEKLWVVPIRKIKKRYIPMMKNGKYGIISFDINDFTTQIVLPNEYDNVNKIIIIDKDNEYYQVQKDNKVALFDFQNKNFKTEFLFDDFTRLGKTHFLKVKKDNKYALLDIKKNKMSKFEYEDIRVGDFKTENFGQNIEVKKNGKWKYKNPVKIIGQGFTQGLIFTSAVLSAPITVPASAVIMGLIYWSCHVPAPKIPDKIQITSEK